MKMVKLRMKAETKRNITLLVLLAPTLALYLVFFVYPVVNGLTFGLYNYDVRSPLHYFIFITPHATFVGLSNYINRALDPLFQRALENTIVITAANSIAQLLIGFSLAWLARKYGRIGNVFLSVALIPIVLSFVSVGLMWKWIYNPQFGLLDSLVKFFHVNDALRFVKLPTIPVSLPSTASTAVLSVLLASNWQGLGLYAVIYSAGLRTIPPSIYDSMRVDGLSDLQKIRHVVWPMMKDTIALALVLVMSSSFKIFDLVFALTGRGPTYTDVISVYLYRYLGSGDAGNAAAVAFYMLIIGLALIIVQFRFFRTKGG
jgi:raffinose/stachyose/melibiose transport system permease protein